MIKSGDIVTGYWYSSRVEACPWGRVVEVNRISPNRVNILLEPFSSRGRDRVMSGWQDVWRFRLASAKELEQLPFLAFEGQDD